MARPRRVDHPPARPGGPLDAEPKDGLRAAATGAHALLPSAREAWEDRLPANARGWEPVSMPGRHRGIRTVIKADGSESYEAR